MLYNCVTCDIFDYHVTGVTVIHTLHHTQLPKSKIKKIEITFKNKINENKKRELK